MLAIRCCVVLSYNWDYDVFLHEVDWSRLQEADLCHECTEEGIMHAGKPPRIWCLILPWMTGLVSEHVEPGGMKSRPLSNQNRCRMPNRLNISSSLKLRRCILALSLHVPLHSSHDSQPCATDHPHRALSHGDQFADRGARLASPAPWCAICLCSCLLAPYNVITALKPMRHDLCCAEPHLRSTCFCGR